MANFERIRHFYYKSRDKIYYFICKERIFFHCRPLHTKVVLLYLASVKKVLTQD